MISSEKKFQDDKILFLFSDKRVNGISYRSNSFGDAPGGLSGLSGVPRKTRFSVFGRLFKPWKWKRRKKSECFEHTSKSESTFKPREGHTEMTSRKGLGWGRRRFWTHE